MTLEELKDQLYRISIEFVKENDSMIDAYSYETLINDLYMSAQRRHIIGDLQLFQANKIIINGNEYTEAVFQFSPNYLNRETEMLFTGMKDLKWKIILENEYDKEADAKAEIVEKLANAYIELIAYENTENISINNFIKSLS